MHGRPDIEFVDWRETDDLGRNEKAIDVTTDNGQTCRVTFSANPTGLSLRADQAVGAVRMSNGVHWLPVPAVTSEPTVEHATPRVVDGPTAPAADRRPILTGDDFELWGAQADTHDVPDDVRALRIALAEARRRVAVYEPAGDPVQAWVLYTGQDHAEDADYDDREGGWPLPALVVLGTLADAQREADQLNLEYIKQNGSLPAAAVTRIYEHAAAVVFGDRR